VDQSGPQKIVDTIISHSFSTVRNILFCWNPLNTGSNLVKTVRFCVKIDGRSAQSLNLVPSILNPNPTFSSPTAASGFFHYAAVPKPNLFLSTWVAVRHQSGAMHPTRARDKPIKFIESSPGCFHFSSGLSLWSHSPRVPGRLMHYVSAVPNTCRGEKCAALQRK